MFSYDYEALGSLLQKVRGFEIVADDFRKHPDVEIKLPTRSDERSAGYDFYTPVDIVLQPGERKLVWTDVKAYFQDDEAPLINVRSSMGKQPIILANVQGWVECDYYGNKDNNGNLGVNLFNLGKTPYVIALNDSAKGFYEHIGFKKYSLIAYVNRKDN